MVEKMQGTAQGKGCMGGGYPDRGEIVIKGKWQCV